MTRKTFSFIIMVIFITAILAGYFSLFYFPHKHAADTMKALLDNLAANKDYVHLLDSSISNKSFIKYFKANELGYEQVKTRRTGKNTYRANVHFTIPEGLVPAEFIIKKINSEYKISSLPRIVNVHGLLIKKEAGSSKKSVEYLTTKGGVDYTITAHPGFSPDFNVPLTFTFMGKTPVKIIPMQLVTMDKILSLSDKHIEGINMGKLTTENLDVYRLEDDMPHYISPSSVPSGTGNAQIFMADNKPVAMFIKKNEIPISTVRVALNKSNFNGLLHSGIELGSEGTYYVETKAAPKLKYKFTNTSVVFKNESGEVGLYHNGSRINSSENRWHISTEKTPISVYSIKRSHTANKNSTSYGGSMEITPWENGMLLVNEIDMEEYLYSVVPSEMPVKFGIEPLKAQAVAARSYAIRSIYSSSMVKYGANMDDSTSSQVYNNVLHQELSNKAVNETKGIVPLYGGIIADTRFFSTSCGYTANYADVWKSPNASFPGPQIPYLVSLPQYNGETLDLSKEKNLKTFIENKALDGFDKHSPYFRWNTVFTGPQLNELAKKTLTAIFNSNPNAVLVNNGSKYVREKNLPDIGSILDLKVLKRGSGGNMIELEIITSQSKYKLIGELNIRRFFKPGLLNLNDGSSRKNFPLLPSAFAFIDIERINKNSISSLTITGGGYGHGVGMSQYGAYGMANKGYDYAHIIDHFYPGTELVKLY